MKSNRGCSAKSDVDRFSIFEQYVRAYGTSRRDPRLDPFHDKRRPWWPMHYFMGPWLLGAWVYRCNRLRSEVALFLAEDHTLYVKDSGIKGALISLLTQTFHQTQRMEVRFVGPRPGEPTTLDTGFETKVPTSIRRVAAELGVRIAKKATISDREGRFLFARLTGFTEQVIAELARRKIDLTRACVAVQRDIWSKEAVDYLLAYAPSPERVFLGGARAEDRLIYLQDLLVLRLVLAAERLEIILRHFSQVESADIQQAQISPNVVRYVSNKALRPLTTGNEHHFELPAGVPFDVELLPRSAQGYAANWSADLACHPSGTSLRIVSVTKDFAWASVVAPPSVVLIPLFDSLSDLDSEIERRLAQVASNRTSLSERQD